ncbi:MAG: glycosyltransferase family 2 protein [Flavobacteriales bacterium]
MPDIFFSIIIPTYNRASFIVKTIQSIINQTYSNFEVIVVDDGSTDNTEEVVKSIKDERIKYYKKENAERGAARNFGTKKAKGDFITFVDSDDIVYNNYLEQANIFINNNPNAKIFHQLFEIKDVEGNLLQRNISIKKNIFKSLVFEGNFMACQGMFLKKDFALEHSFIEDRDISASEDYELWLRIACNYEILINPVVTSSLIEHHKRSVLQIDPNGLIKRKIKMTNILISNPKIEKRLLPYKNVLWSNAYSYISLHLAMTNYKKESIKYLFKSIKKAPYFIFKIRFLAIVKHLLISFKTS